MILSVIQTKTYAIQNNGKYIYTYNTNVKNIQYKLQTYNKCINDFVICFTILTKIYANTNGKEQILLRLKCHTIQCPDNVFL